MTQLQAILLRLEEAADPTYRDFSKSLLPQTGGEILGVRIPVLRQIAKDLAKQDYTAFLQSAQGETLFELEMLRGLVIAYAPCTAKERMELLRAFVPTISNWSVCDSVAATLKDARKYPTVYWEFLHACLFRAGEYEVRFGVVMLMDHFLTKEYIHQVLECLEQVRHPGYYVKMGVAWALSFCYIQFPAETRSLLDRRVLDPWVQNKAIQKCRESYRVTPEDKQMLLAYKL